ncbi:MAG: TIGR01906 family membrane protein [Clostridium sp.]|uniref:TIGR01906 family membrane protein n=1 Tax=Clostridium sp. TaxID=1506 RepID=UPI002FC8124F
MKYFYLTLISVSSFLVILLGSLFISTYDKDFYIKQFHINNTYQNQMVIERNINPEIIADEVIEYLKGSSDNLNRNGYFERKEIIHMKDVLHLFNIGKIAFVVGIVILGLSLYMLHKTYLRGREYILSIIKSYYIFSMGIIGFLILCALNFSESFIVFHELLFTNDYWLLNPNTSIIINIMPESFFLSHTINIFVLFITISITLTIALFIMLYLFNKKLKEDNYANIRK